MEEPSFEQPLPTAIISEASSNTRIRLIPVIESDKQQLQQFCNACKGIPQVTDSNSPLSNASSTVPPPTAPPTNPSHTEDDLELEMEMAINASLQSAAQTSNGANPTVSTSATSAGIPSGVTHGHVPTPSASMVMDEHSGVIDDFTVSSSAVDTSSACVVCLDAPLEAACVPCGHIAGCVPCLSEIESLSGACPICRAKIDHVMKVYTV